MRFPLASPPFPELTLSPAQCDEFAELTSTVREQTLAEYERFVQREQRRVNRRLWKPVKKRENVTVFKKADREDIDGTEWSLPKLLAVGTIPGNLDDVMYGDSTPDADAFKLRTSYIHDELVDGRVLHTIQGPTEEDPFRFLGIKWVVKTSPPTVSAVVWPRDFVMVVAIGVHVLATGERIGYHVAHSVDLPECPELRARGIIRSRLSACYLYKQLRKQTVEVYMQTFAAAGGSAPDVVAIMSAANALIGCWKTVWCAQNKKLAWLMREATSARDRERLVQEQRQQDPQSHSQGGGSSGSVTSTSSATTSTPHCGSTGKACCATCTKSIGPFHKNVPCDLCQTINCSRCRVTRKISYIRRNGGAVKQVAKVFCNNCIANSNRVSSAEVARYEYVPGAQERRDELQLRRLQSAEGQSSRHHHHNNNDDDDDDTASNVSDDDDDELLLPPRHEEDGDGGPSRGEPGSDEEELLVETMEDWRLKNTPVEDDLASASSTTTEDEVVGR